MAAMDLAALRQVIEQRARAAPGLRARVDFVFDDGDVLHLDATRQPPEISEGSTDPDADLPDTTLRVSKDTLSRIIGGELGATMAFMTGKLKVSGDMQVALKLQEILED